MFLFTAEKGHKNAIVGYKQNSYIAYSLIAQSCVEANNGTHRFTKARQNTGSALRRAFRQYRNTGLVPSNLQLLLSMFSPHISYFFGCQSFRRINSNPFGLLFSERQ